MTTKIISVTDKNKKTFNLDDNDKQIVTSGGVIIYKFVKNHIELLLVNSRGGYEDFGGKIDSNDKTIYDTIAREAYEESNCLLKKLQIKKRLTCATHVYIKKSKYVVYIIKATTIEANMKTEDFGDKELHDDISRKVKWIKLEEFLRPEVIKHKLNWRLKSSTLFAELNSIKNNEKLELNMFLKSSSKSA